jgi:hypothetical protein
MQPTTWHLLRADRRLRPVVPAAAHQADRLEEEEEEEEEEEPTVAYRTAARSISEHHMAAPVAARLEARQERRLQASAAGRATSQSNPT